MDSDEFPNLIIGLLGAIFEKYFPAVPRVLPFFPSTFRRHLCVCSVIRGLKHKRFWDANGSRNLKFLTTNDYSTFLGSQVWLKLLKRRPHCRYTGVKVCQSLSFTLHPVAGCVSKESLLKFSNRSQMTSRSGQSK